MYVEHTGVIGYKSHKPTMTWDYRERGGKRVRVPFIRFSMWVEDQTKKQVLNAYTGKMERPKEVVQVILPEGDRGVNLFPNLSPGRQVTVKGRQTLDPQVGTNSEEKEQIYPNLRVYMDELRFNDSPIEYQIKRVLALLVSAEAITNDDVGRYREAADSYLKAQEEANGSPRKIEDRTTDADAGF